MIIVALPTLAQFTVAPTLIGFAAEQVWGAPSGGSSSPWPERSAPSCEARSSNPLAPEIP
jgi:hypothetical protein